jgi:transcriptional regulator with XRE-family HTH domain
MNTTFALDLKVARRKSGLSQLDCAHLLDVHPSRVSKLESGKRLPTVHEICTLSLIYGRTFESLFGSIFEDARKLLRAQLATIPESQKQWGSLGRNHTLNAIAARLEEAKPTEHDGL